MRTRSLVVVLACIVVVLAPGQVLAHDLQIVVKLPPNAPTELVVEAGFDDETPAEDTKVTIHDAAGLKVNEGKTDERGVCRFARPAPGKYVATVEAYGHKDAVEFEVAGSVAAVEYRGWRPDKKLGLIAGVGGLLAISAAYWLLRRKRVGESGV